MLDISSDLVNVMLESNCSSVYALFQLEKEKADVYILQSEPSIELCGGLRDTSDLESN